MEYNNLLSIALTTYNRAKFLDYWLKYHIPIVKKYNIKIIVSDDHSSDETINVIEKYIKEYPLIEFHSNEKNIGFDRNVERVLKYSDTEYVWLLGESYMIPENGIEYILELISKNNKKYDAIIVNYDGHRLEGIESKDYSDKNQLLMDLGWHMTLLSVYIFNSKIVKEGNFSRYYDTTFIQVGVLFEYISYKNFIVHFAENILVTSITKKTHIVKNPVHKEYIKIWVNDWVNVILSLPPIYKIDTKLKVIKDWGIKTGELSGFKGLINLIAQRENNWLNYDIYKKYSNIFKFTLGYPKFIILFISLFPRPILSIIKKYYKKYNKKYIYLEYQKS